jgi:exodeoxyribonuclease VII small subunit
MSTEESNNGPGDADEPGYGAAMAELEQILQELEGEDPDVDVLATRVERAATLIEICRRRITNASVQVERVVAALESDTET